MEFAYNKNRKIISIISLSVLFVALLILTEANNTQSHEAVHEKICEYLGGHTEVKAGIFSGYTKCSYSATEEQRLQKYELDTYNEIVGYNIDSLRYTIWCAIFFLFIGFITYKDF